MTSKKLPKLSKMAQEASKTARETPQTPPHEPRKAKIIEKQWFFHDFSGFVVIAPWRLQEGRRWLSNGPRWSQDGPKTRKDDPKSGPRGFQGGSRWPKSGPLGLQDGSKKAPRKAPRGFQEGHRAQVGSETSPGIPWHPPGPLRGAPRTVLDPSGERFCDQFGLSKLCFTRSGKTALTRSE